jgi:hypothetical protein
MNSGTSAHQHLFPIKIALRAQQLIQGSLFYDVFVDTATGLYVRVIPDAEGTIKAKMVKDGINEETYETSWSCFRAYLNEFQNPIYHRTIFSIISHWDWFISNLGRFINFGEKILSPRKQPDKNLLKLSFKPFSKQIEIIKKESRTPLIIDQEIIDLVEEMNLVRNIGMHNEWDVDETYLKYTKTKQFKFGQKRIFDISEMTRWHGAFLKLIDTLSSEIAIRYSHVPNFE